MKNDGGTIESRTAPEDGPDGGFSAQVMARALKDLMSGKSAGTKRPDSNN